MNIASMIINAISDNRHELLTLVQLVALLFTLNAYVEVRERNNHTEQQLRETEDRLERVRMERLEYYKEINGNSLEFRPYNGKQCEECKKFDF